MEDESLSIGIVPSSAPDWRDICQSRNHSRLFMRFLLSTHWGQLCEFAFHFMIGELKKGSCVCLLAKLLGLHLPGWGSRGKMSGEVEGDIFAAIESHGSPPSRCLFPFKVPWSSTINLPALCRKQTTGEGPSGGELARGLQVNSPTKELRIRGNSLGLSAPAIPYSP